MQYSLEDGEAFVKAARNSIELYIRSPRFERSMVSRILERYNSDSGVFVTIKHYPTLTLRGCVGFPNPVGPLNRLLVEAAIAAAFEDPRFVPISQSELGECLIEVSVLTKPEQIAEKTDRGRLKEVTIGRDGLLIKYGFKSGLLLPEVPVEEKWNKTEFMQNVCLKAGLPQEAWRMPDIALYKFSAQVFTEVEPEGRVEEVSLMK